MEERLRTKSRALFVAAIDFGATRTTYAFSLATSRLRIIGYNRNDGTCSDSKAPTCLLLKKDCSVLQFGYKAEEMYSKLIADKNENLEDYYFFQGFRMTFHKNVSANRRILCKDINGKTLEAGTVLSFCIKYLKEQTIAEIVRRTPDMTAADVEFVLSVPAIWGEKGKIFIREAATKAGLVKDRLAVILEPEAVSVYCQYAHITKETSLGIFKPGTKYIILNLGVSAAITVHRKCEDNSLEELLPTRTGPWGAASVDHSFVDFLRELVGGNVIENMKENHMDIYLDIMDSFTVKRNNSTYSKGLYVLTLPQSFVTLCNNVHNVVDFRQIIEKKTLYKDNVNFHGDKLKFKPSFFAEFFKKTVNSIVKQLDELFEEDIARDIDIVILVGEFSSCLFVQEAIRKNFEDKKVFMPDEGGLVAVKGAVFFGHVPEAISRRPSQYAYGFQIWPEFRPGHHPEEKKFNMKGSLRCRDVFFQVVRKGENIMPGYTKSEILEIPNGEECLKCCLFFTDIENTTFVDEPGCKLLGVLRIPLSAINDEASFKIEETLIFGESELEFRVKDVSSGVQHKAIFDLFEH